MASVALAAIALTLLTGCNSRPDRHVQSALEEMREVEALTVAAKQYSEFSPQLDQRNRSVEKALARSKDAPAKAQVRAAMALYLEGRDTWSRIDDAVSAAELAHLWKNAHASNRFAAEFAAADDPKRELLAAVEAERRKAETLLAAEAERRRLEMAELAAAKAVREAQARRVAEAEADARETREKLVAATSRALTAEERNDAAAAERRRELEQAQERTASLERERLRRYAPVGTVYNLKPLSMHIADGLTTMPPGTELKIVSRRDNGVIAVQHGEKTALVSGQEVTNDRDLAAHARNFDLRRQGALQQWQAEQSAELRRQQEEAAAAAAANSTSSVTEAILPVRENPLARPAY